MEGTELEQAVSGVASPAFSMSENFPSHEFENFSKWNKNRIFEQIADINSATTISRNIYFKVSSTMNWKYSFFKVVWAT